MNKVVQLIYIILGSYLLIIGNSLWSQPIDGEGIGFNPLGIEILIYSRSKDSLAIFLMLLGIIVLLPSIFLSLLALYKRFTKVKSEL